MDEMRPDRTRAELGDDVIEWLMDSDPAIRWQVMRDLMGMPEGAVAVERERVAMEGWGAALLGRQRSDGLWGDGTAVPQWQSTLGALVLLRDMGLEPASAQALKAIARVRDQVTWGSEFGDAPFFSGEVEPCINGRVLGLGAYFGHPDERLLDRLLREQLSDGGWNCEAERGSVRSSFHTTICVLEGLLAYERAHEGDGAVIVRIRSARQRGEEYLLARRLFRRLSTGEVIRDRRGGRDWRRFTYPTWWHYDVLRALDYFRAAGAEPDERLAEAISALVSRRGDDGRWPLDEPHEDLLDLEMEEADRPSRWNTLRALRVLNWC